MFLFVCLLSGCAIQVVRRIRSNYVLQVHKVKSGEVVHNFITDSWFLCHVATWTSHVATSNLCLCHVATRNSHVATSLVDPLCHVATLTNTSRRQKYMSLSRRDVEFPRRDVSFTLLDVSFTLLCYVATSIYTSRRGLVQVSVTS